MKETAVQIAASIFFAVALNASNVVFSASTVMRISRSPFEEKVFVGLPTML